jgi:hypothetical protein
MIQGFKDTLRISGKGGRAVHQAGLRAIKGDFQGAKELLEQTEGEFGTTWRTLVKDDPILDNVTKFEHDRRAITAENFGISRAKGASKTSRILGGSVDLLGTTVRLPGRLLLTGDELFKGLNYQMELNALAMRDGLSKGLSDTALAEHVARVVDNPSNSMHLNALEFSRVSTFTNELGKPGQAIQGLVQNVPILRLVAPFVRTPVNIVKFAWNRTPLGLFGSKMQADVIGRNGAAAQDLAIARMSLGTSIFGSFLAFADEEKFTGAMPPHAAEAWKADGKQAYSVKVGDRWVAYNRLDPLAMILGVAADVHQIGGQLDESDLDDLALITMTALANNITNKVYLSGVINLTDALSQPERFMETWMQSMASPIVPNFFAQTATTVDPVQREVWEFMDVLKKRVPGWSEELKPVRDIFGLPVEYDGGLGPDWMTPVYTKNASKDPIRNELARVFESSSVKAGSDRGLSRVPRMIDGVELTAEQYDFWQIEAGKDLHKDLERLMKSRKYQRAADGTGDVVGGRAFLIKQVWSANKAKGKGKMLKKFEDDLVPQLEDRNDEFKDTLVNRILGQDN